MMLLGSAFKTDGSGFWLCSAMKRSMAANRSTTEWKMPFFRRLLVSLAKKPEYGLSAVVTGDREAAKPVASQLRAGLAGIITWGPVADAPFGRYKRSGNGREAGVYGLRDFLEVKSIVGG
jgi:hypothetical protein